MPVTVICIGYGDREKTTAPSREQSRPPVNLEESTLHPCSEPLAHVWLYTDVGGGEVGDIHQRRRWETRERKGLDLGWERQGDKLRGGGREGGEHGGVRDRKKEREERKQGDTAEGGREGAGRRGRREGKTDKGEDVQASWK